MVDNLDIDPKVPVLTSESLKDFKNLPTRSASHVVVAQ